MIPEAMNCSIQDGLTRRVRGHAPGAGGARAARKGDATIGSLGVIVLAAGLCWIGAVGPLSAQAPPTDLGNLFSASRLRFEYADQGGLEPSRAWTLRGRVGYASPRRRGFSALVELEGNWVLNPRGFASYPPPSNDGRAVVADPQSLLLNRAFLAWSGEPWDGRRSIWTTSASSGKWGGGR
jgi:hypothetical protein